MFSRWVRFDGALRASFSGSQDDCVVVWEYIPLEPGARYHAVAEEGVAVRDIADVIGRGLKVPVVALSPEEAAGHFGWLGMFAGMNLPASSALTRERLGWHPTGPGLITDLENMRYAIA